METTEDKALRVESLKMAAEATAMQEFLEYGQATLTAVVRFADEKTGDLVLIAPHATRREKEDMKLAIAAAHVFADVLAVAIFGEVWLAREASASVAPSAQPDRSEAVMILFDDGDPSSCEIVLHEIRRENGRSPTLGKRTSVTGAAQTFELARLLAEPKERR